MQYIQSMHKFVCTNPYKLQPPRKIEGKRVGPESLGTRDYMHNCMFQHSQSSGSVMSNCLRPHGQEHARLPCPSPTPRVHPNRCPLSRWCRPTISSSVVPFSSSFNLCQHQGLFQWVNSSHQVAKELELQLKHQSYQWIPRISFRMDWLDLLTAQGTLKSLHQQREEPRWRRSRTGRTLSPLQIHQKSI